MKRRMFAALLSACMMLAFGSTALAADQVITFDSRPQLELMKLPDPGDTAKPLGTYLSSGTSTIILISTGQVRISADTNCYRKCASVYAGAYLYQVNDGAYTYITQKDGYGSDTYSVVVYKDQYVARQHYYQVKGSHSVKAYDGTVETAGSWTDIVYVP